MFLARWLFYPSLGKEGEMLDLLKEFVKEQQRQGVYCDCAQRVFSPNGPVFGIGPIYHDLAAEEEHRHRSADDPAVKEINARLNALSRAWRSTELWEVLVHPNVHDLPERYRYVSLTHFYPAIGKEKDLQALLTEQVTLDQARVAVGLQTARWSADGTVLTVIVPIVRLADNERVAREQGANTALQQTLARAAEMTRRSAHSELWEHVVSYPHA